MPLPPTPPLLGSVEGDGSREVLPSALPTQPEVGLRISYCGKPGLITEVEELGCMAYKIKIRKEDRQEMLLYVSPPLDALNSTEEERGQWWKIRDKVDTEARKYRSAVLSWRDVQDLLILGGVSAQIAAELGLPYLTEPSLYEIKGLNLGSLSEEDLRSALESIKSLKEAKPTQPITTALAENNLKIRATAMGLSPDGLTAETLEAEVEKWEGEKANTEGFRRHVLKEEGKMETAAQVHEFYKTIAVSLGSKTPTEGDQIAYKALRASLEYKIHLLQKAAAPSKRANAYVPRYGARPPVENPSPSEILQAEPVKDPQECEIYRRAAEIFTEEAVENLGIYLEQNGGRVKGTPQTQDTNLPIPKLGSIEEGFGGMVWAIDFEPNDARAPKEAGVFYMDILQPDGRMLRKELCFNRDDRLWPSASPWAFYVENHGRHFLEVHQKHKKQI